MASAKRVAVIGLGALGLVTLKNLVEEGFDVVGFERNSYIGGLWQYTEQRQTSVLKSTVVNVSKERGCFTDFPFPDGTSSYPSAAEVEQYLLAYAKHFQLESRFRLNTTIVRVTRDDQAAKWTVVARDAQGKETDIDVDKVVLANGINRVPNVPILSNQEAFTGRVLHSVEFKIPEEFKDKRILVVGIGNTAADTATCLVGIAREVYLSHNQGAFVLSRTLPNGQALDHGLSYRKIMIQYTLMKHVPRLADAVGDKFIKSAQDQSFDIRPEWKLSPAPPLIHHVPVVSETLIPALQAGDIKSVAAPAKVLNASTIELGDGSRVDVDTIIWCTGYHTDFSVLGPFDPTLHSPPTKQAGSLDAKLPQERQPTIPRLYRNIFSLDYPESLAIVGAAAFPSPAFQTYDLASMAIAQLWKEPSRFPPRGVMLRSVDEHLQWAQCIAAKGSLNPCFVQAPEWMDWVEDTAGFHVSDHLGYGLCGWNFWLRDRKFCQLLMDGILSPHIYRLFDSERRKKWDGAREAIERLMRK